MPQGSMRQFFRERGGPDSEHGERLWWPGTIDGFPVRSRQAPHMRQHEVENIPLAMEFHSGAFRLWVPEEQRRFNGVMNRILNGWYMQHKRFDQWVEKEFGYWVWLEWAQIYGEVPDAISPGRGPDVHTTTAQFDYTPTPGPDRSYADEIKLEL